jgi:hypothetical protein
VRMVSRDGCFERTPEIADRLNADYGRSPQLHGLIRSYVLSSLAKRHDYSFVALRWRSDWSTGIVEKILDDGGGRSYAEPSLHALRNPPTVDVWPTGAHAKLRHFFCAAAMGMWPALPCRRVRTPCVLQVTESSVLEQRHSSVRGNYNCAICAR